MMPPRTIAFLFVSLLLATAAGYSNWRYLVASSNTADSSTGILQQRDVVVARTEMSMSEPVNAVMVKLVKWPEELIPNGAFHSVDDVLGRIPRRRHTPGEPILESGLFGQGAIGGLSPLIQTGLRAMSVKVDEVIGIAGFVNVGSSVDVLATLRRSVESEAFSQVVLQDVRVLAVDQALEPSDAEPDERVSVVTLEVTPTQAKKLAFAASQGSIQLALRHPSDADLASTSSVGTPHLKGEDENAAGNFNKVTILRGIETSSQSFPARVRNTHTSQAPVYTPSYAYSRPPVDAVATRVDGD